MKYLEIKSIVRHVKKKMPCQGCGRCYKERDVNVVAVFQGNVFLELACPDCNIRMVVQVSLMPDSEELSFRQHSLERNGEPISQDEILDMHNFLKNFKGDFRNFLKG